MPKYCTRYNPDWKNSFKFIKQGSNEFKANCRDCKSVFSIKSGHTDILRHINGKNIVKLLKHQ